MTRRRAAELLRLFARAAKDVSWLGSQTTAPDYEEYELVIKGKYKYYRNLLIKELTK